MKPESPNSVFTAGKFYRSRGGHSLYKQGHDGEFVNIRDIPPGGIYYCLEYVYKDEDEETSNYRFFNPEIIGYTKFLGPDGLIYYWGCQGWRDTYFEIVTEYVTPEK